MGLRLGAGHDQMYAGHVFGARGIDVFDARMGALGPHRHRVQAVAVGIVVAKTAAACDQTLVLPACRRLTDPGFTGGEWQVLPRIGLGAAGGDFHRLNDV